MDPITFNRAQNLWSQQMKDFYDAPEKYFVVEMTNIEHPELKVVQEVTARCHAEAVYGALGWMNMPSSWTVTNMLFEGDI